LNYTVSISRKAQKSLSKIPTEMQDKIINKIRNLATDPHPRTAKKLSGREAWRIRIGIYRVIYEIHNDILAIIVIMIAHRKDIYKK